MYYPHNPTSHSAHSESDPQHVNQMNGSVQPIGVSPPNAYPPAYGHPQNPYNPQPPGYTQPTSVATRPNYQKSGAAVPPSYPPSATLPQQMTQMAGRPDSRTQPINSLSHQMSNISLSSPQALQSPNSSHSGQAVQTAPATLNQMPGSNYSGPQPSHLQNAGQLGGQVGQAQTNFNNWQPNVGQVTSPNWQPSVVQNNMPSQPHPVTRYPPPPTIPPKMTDQGLASNQMASQPMPGRYPMAPMMNQMPSQPLQGQMGSPTMPPQSAQPGFSQPAYSSQSQQRLDLEAMPSVVQVIEEDRAKFENNDNVLFTTSIPCSVPPLVTTFGQYEHSITNDGGCARPHHIRSTIYQVPINEDTLKTTSIPLAIVVQPFDDTEVDGKNVSN